MPRKKISNPPTLDDLPMFASDIAIAEAIVGHEAAGAWMRERLPTLAAKPGFPPVDPFHGGRPVPLVKRFYEQYLGLPDDPRGRPSGKENPDAWRKPRPRA